MSGNQEVLGRWWYQSSNNAKPFVVWFPGRPTNSDVDLQLLAQLKISQRYRCEDGLVKQDIIGAQCWFWYGLLVRSLPAPHEKIVN